MAIPVAPKVVTNASPNPGNSTTSIPTGKVGNATGALPTPTHGKSDHGKPSPAATPKVTPNHSAHNHSSAKPTTHGLGAITPLPTAPKFETNGKIPPFGSALSGSHNHSTTTSDHKHDHTTVVSPRHSGNSLPVIQPSTSGHVGDHHTGNRPSVHHHGSSSYSNHRHSGGLSWLIVGGAYSRPCSYGYGYGPGYFGPTYVYSAPTTVYVPTPVVESSVSINSYSTSVVAPPQQQQLTPDEFAALPLERQRELLLQALNALEEDFTRSPNGADWSRHLQLATIAKLVTEGDERPDATLRARLRSVAQLFDEVAANADYKAVSELTSFRVLHIGLHEFAAEEIDRSRRQLSNAASQLSKKLETWSNGQRWRDYLQTEWMIGTDEEMQIDLEARLVRFEKLLDKFDRVASDDQFQAVTQPREFGLAHDALRRFVGHLQQLVAEVRNTEQPKPADELVIPAAPR